MAFELTEDFVKDNELTEKQVTSLTTLGTSYSDTLTADLKKEYDETYKETANKNAENILTDALKLVGDKTGISRNDGEKAGEYIPRAWGAFSKSEQDAIDKLKLELDDKVKNFDGDPETKRQLQEMTDKFDVIQKKTANYDDLVGFEDKYNTLSTEHLTMKEEVCFGKVRPNFPDTVDEYRATAKWNEFMAEVKKEYTVEIVNGEAMAKSKENEYKTFKLSELVDKNETITELMKGRQQKGPGAKGIDLQDIDGVPFKVDSKATTADKAKLITEHLAKDGIDKLHPEYTSKFKVIFDKIKQGTA